MQVKSNSWIHNLAPILIQNNIPVAIADLQLSDQFNKLTALVLKDFNLLPPAPLPFRIIHKDGIYCIDGDLLGSIMATPVTIAWKKEGTIYTFWWHQLAVQDILATENTNEQEKAHLANILGENVIVNNCICPHFTILFQTTLEINPAMFAQLKKQIIGYTEYWNANHGAQGIVHNIYEIKQSTADTIALKLDVGSADLEFLKTLFKKLEGLYSLLKITIS